MVKWLLPVIMMIVSRFVNLTLQILADLLTYDNFQFSIFNFQFY